jgi:carboxymethylenebutenolidase
MTGQDTEIGYLALPEAGGGPGLLLFCDVPDRGFAELWAEEGYVVLQAADAGAAPALRSRPEVTGKIGALGFGAGARPAAGCGADAAVIYDPIGVDWSGLAGGTPLTVHIGDADPGLEPLKAAIEGRADIELFVYPGVGQGFSHKGRPTYDKPATSMAASRTIAALRRVLGPDYDLGALWEEHCHYEFVERDVPKTMATMVAEPYVNHVPTMTGGVGQKELARFYQHHFVNSNPKDTRIVPVSRTIGADRLVDEVLFCFTHDVEIDWMLPGIKPTGKYVEVPLVAIINFRGAKLYHEHIYWDQASVLAQIGLLDPKLLPVGGRAAAEKLIDETRPSNTLMTRWKESKNR